MIDQWGRKIDYLRISITDRCNLRCKYCMPERDIKFMPKENLLSIDEIYRVAKLSSELGVAKVRITGGEPLVREGIVDLIRSIKSLVNIKEVCLTTNGILLAKHLDNLLRAGLDRVNISLDTLKEDLYRQITGGGDIRPVWGAIEGCLEKGIIVKLNTVVMKDFNDNEILDFVKLTEQKPLDVRFIEVMPIGAGKAFKTKTAAQIKEDILQERNLILCIGGKINDGPASYYKLDGGLGRIGFINPMSHSFCGSCNRIRLTAEGFLKQCLHWKGGENLAVLMRQGISDTALSEIINKCIFSKPEQHGFHETSADSDKRYMYQVGG